jgi:O-acetyl-ADP-ribose deacetylase (regulator of RNase III)
MKVDDESVRIAKSNVVHAAVQTCPGDGGIFTSVAREAGAQSW